MSSMLVTGYVPIANHPRKPEEYDKLAEKIADISDLLPQPPYFIQHPIERCWLYNFIKWSGIEPTHSVADNPAKNSMAYHIVQHQKVVWLVQAAFNVPDVDVLCWVDVGIHSAPGINNAIIADAIMAAQNETSIVIPGCWSREQGKLAADSQVNWRYCGGAFFVSPKVAFVLA